MLGKKCWIFFISSQKYQAKWKMFKIVFQASQKVEAICKRIEKMFPRCLIFGGRLGNFIPIAQKFTRHLPFPILS
jgi:hypothetical protein